MDLSSTPETILIVADVSVEGQCEVWKNAVTKAEQVLLDAGRPDILIEIIDKKRSTAFNSVHC